MLNIENYDQWAKVCDDDDLIMELYNSGIRPGTTEFVELLGKPNSGKPASSKDKAILFGGMGLAVIFTWVFVKIIKAVVRKIKRLFSSMFSKKKDS